MQQLVQQRIKGRISWGQADEKRRSHIVGQTGPSLAPVLSGGSESHEREGRLKWTLAFHANAQVGAV